jgi:hypothetical protein
MKTRIFSASLITLAAVVIGISGYQCAGGKKASGSEQIEVITTNSAGTGARITLSFSKGSSHNHPLMAIWVEDATGKYIETLYVAKSIGKGVFEHADKSGGQWQPGPIRRPAALPYWGHKRGIKASDGYYLPTPEEPVADAVTGPTPQGSFVLNSRRTTVAPATFKVMLEINQSWDWNEFWTNDKYPDDPDYKTSSQPALIYEAYIDMNDLQKEYVMAPAGRSHHSGKDGMLYTDLETLTSAKTIAEKISLSVLPE